MSSSFSLHPTSSSSSSSSHPATCPCKFLSLNLSIFTSSSLGAPAPPSRPVKLRPISSPSGSSYTALPTDDYGYSPLHYAAQNNHVPLVSHFLSLLSAANPSPASLSLALSHSAPPLPPGCSPLHRACFSGAVPSLLLLLPHLELQALLLADASTGGPPMTPLQKCVVAGRAGSAYVLLCRAASLPAPALLSVLNPSSVPASSLASYWRSFSSSHGDVDPASRWDSVAGSPGSLPPTLAAILSFLPHLEPGSSPPPLPLDAAAPVLLPAPAADPAAVWSSQFRLACPPAPAPALQPAPEPDPPPPAPGGAECDGCGRPAVAFRRQGERLLCLPCSRKPERKADAS
ncbi:hypothetical protein TeGR_g13290 [Tetraparma gracilis]|uniref:Uncharacterized protein n=1 Tax=Tetraparma gracilis TaxID=2962635 RepID=A0ABQ6MBG9_9STRA|nr:hypothetical protein TeGR_g13290 [Tetraparma gracilis]